MTARDAIDPAPRAQRVVVGDHALEVVEHGPRAGRALVLLHEGLGSVSAWRDWPAQLASTTGLRTIVYSRRGYGSSDPCPLPRPLTYMHDEAKGDLPALLDALHVDDCVLVGHSDGGSIAILYTGGFGTSAPPARVRGVALLAPHVFVEDVSVASIAQAKVAYETSDLRARLAKHHAHVDVAFRGWNGAWLDPGFRAWNITSSLPSITAPVLVVQGEGDPYGTLEQVETIRAGVTSSPSCRVLVVPECGHAPWKERPAETTAAIASFVAALAV